MKYQLTPIRMVIIKKTRDNKCWQKWGERGEKRTLPHCWWIQLMWKNSMEVPQKIKNSTTIWCLPSSKPTSRYTCKQDRIRISAAFFTTVKTRKQPTCLLMVLLSRSVMCDAFATPGTIARQAPLSMGFSGKNTGVGSRFLFQGIFPTQGLNPRLLHRQADSFPASHRGSPSGC